RKIQAGAIGAGEDLAQGKAGGAQLVFAACLIEDGFGREARSSPQVTLRPAARAGSIDGAVVGTSEWPASDGADPVPAGLGLPGAGGDGLACWLQAASRRAMARVMGDADRAAARAPACPATTDRSRAGSRR